MVAGMYSSTRQQIEVDKLATNIQYGLNEAMNEGGVGHRIFRLNEIIRGRMVDNGSLEHIGKVGLFDLDGDCCYVSYLVRIVPDSSKVLPRYLGCIMNSEVFRKGMVSLAVKSGDPNNIKATKMKNIKVPVPSLAEQKKLVAKIDALEKQISDAQAVIDGAAARKQAILQKYL
ncbi:restriction endonuclease subunit S [Limnobacter sp.]|uniref:restriction endonuclease subunit S n=1 Tax=Limnobacter sp. TaxID=2003368 RepID=UPI003511DF40